MDKSSNSTVINFLDDICFSEEDEYMKRYYQKSNSADRLTSLVEYYKYHKDIPRSFMMPESDVVNGKPHYSDYHDKMRKVNYYKIKRFLHAKSGNVNKFQMSQDSSSDSDSSESDDSE